MRFSAVTSCLTERGAEGAVDTIAALGYDGVEFLVSGTLLPQDASPDRRRDLRRRCADLNLAVAGLNGSLPATGHRILADDPAERQVGRDQLLRVIDLCADIGGQTVTVGSPGARNFPAGMLPDTWYPRALEAFRQWGEYSATLGVSVTVEIINRFECNWGRTIQDGLEFLTAAGHANLGLTIDTFHMNIEEGPFAAALARGADSIHHVHVADSNRQAPGQGNLDFPAFLQALTATGYDGFVSVELFPLWYGIALAQPGEEALRRGLSHLRAALRREA